MTAMTAGDERALMVEAMWRGTDPTVVYLAGDRGLVAAGLDALDQDALDQDALDRVACWQSCEHDMISADLGEPPMSVAALDQLSRWCRRSSSSRSRTPCARPSPPAPG
ncbi:hypothetical protein [Streptomyces sp. NPDC052042]|uniref:hypothetical protein n=1 Tax=Streptomyces sp. NPDC052042 TaxID=3365683 RepID=UPI0037D1CA32